MTYLAPRQGLFAVVLLISFCLHCLFFIASSQMLLKKQEEQISSALAVRLIDDIKTPLMVGDRVSLAVIAKRYLLDPSIAYLAIYDENGLLLVPVGDGTLTNQGKTWTVSNGATIYGKVLLKTTPIGHADIMGKYWSFILAMLVLHVFLWMSYGYIARPTKKLQAQIAALLREQWHRPAAPPATSVSHGVDNVSDIAPPANLPQEATPATPDKLDINSFFRAKLSRSPPASANPLVKDGKTMVVRLMFSDANNMLSLLLDNQAALYFALCDALLEKTTQAVLSLPQLSGVVRDSGTAFSNQGAVLCLKNESASDGNTHTLALAAVLLAYLFVLVNDVVYHKHCQTSLFALPIKAMACDDTRFHVGEKLLQQLGSGTLLLMNAEQIKRMANFMNVKVLNSSAVHEPCYTVGELSETLAMQLTRLRKQILSA